MTTGTAAVDAPSVADVLAARKRIAGRVRRTPLAHSAWLSALTGADVHLKLETLQLTHSFKIRGAYNALLSLIERHADGDPAHARPAEGLRVVTASAGNHGRGLAHAADALNVRATIFTPRNAAETKLAAMRRHRADLRSIAADYEEAESMAKQFAREEGAVFVSAYSNRDVIAGAGTIALELMEDLPAADVLVCPVGGGGLMSGVACTLRHLVPDCRIIGVEAQASPAFHASLAAGRITTVDVQPTIADGLAGNMDPDSMTFGMIQRASVHIELVSEEELANGIRALAAEERLIAEAAGVAGVAALMSGRIDVKGRRVAVVLSGANIDAGKLAGLLQPR